MKKTAWAPGTATGITERLLGREIRRCLPSRHYYRCDGWLFGRRSVPISESDRNAECQLFELLWRLREERSVDERESAEFEFSGQALMSGARVDFCGEALMDLATGGYVEFQLKIWGER